MRDQKLGRILGVLPKLAREIKGSFSPEAGYHINKTEFIALMEISKKPHQPMKHYIRAVGIESGSFTYLADELESKGYICRVSSADDKRRTVLEMTEQGQRVTADLRKKADAHVAKRLEKLSDEDVERLKNAVYTLEDILKKLETHHG